MVGKKVDKIAMRLDSWWKILTAVIALILFIYNVSAVWLELVDAQDRLKQMEELIEREDRLRDERWDRKYKELYNMIKELRDRGIDLTQDYQDHLIQDAYQRGKVDQAMQDLDK